MSQNETGNNIVHLVDSFKAQACTTEQIRYRHTLLTIALAFESGDQNSESQQLLQEAGGNKRYDESSEDGQTIFGYYDVAEAQLASFIEAMEAVDNLLSAAITSTSTNMCFPEGIGNGARSYFSLPDTKTQNGPRQVIYQNSYRIVQSHCPKTQLENLRTYFDAELFEVEITQAGAANCNDPV